MKKLLLLFALFCISIGLWAQSGDYQGIEISFNKSAATETNFMNVTVKVKDLDGNAISGVTAEPVSWAASDLINSSMGNTAALGWTEKVLIGGRYSNNNYASAAAQDFVFKISGLRTDFAFNKAEVDLYGCNQSGASVNSSKISISCAIQTGDAANNLSAFVSSTGNKINGSQEGGLWHKVATMKNSTEKTVGENEDLYVKVTIQKTADGDGTKCRPSFRTVKLLMAMPYTVTENSENLSEITDYTSYDSFIVPTGKTLNIDVENFDLTKIQGAGTIAFNDATTATSGIASDFTGTLDVNNASAAVTISGNLGACTIQKTSGTLTYTGTNLNGTTLDGAILGGSERISTSGTTNIKNLTGNNLTGGTKNYAFIGSGTLNFYGTCDLTKKSDGSTSNSYNKVGYPSSASIVINEGANVTTDNFYNSGTNNAPITNNGTITSRYFGGAATLGEGSTTTLSDETPFRGAVTVSGDATLNLTNNPATLSQAITVASGKTLTIDGNNNAIAVTGTVTNNGTIEFKNAILSLNFDDRNLNSLTNYTFTNCTTTLQFKETGDEYKEGGFTITNIPAGVTIKVKKYDATDYETVTPTDGTATISHSVGVSGYAAWLDYTFNLSTIEANTHDPADQVINNAGNAGSDKSLEIDTGYDTDNSYNEDGTLKVMSTPYRKMEDDMAWPTNYTVAVAGNVPDVENGCLVAFGSTTRGSKKYLAIIRGANQNEIKLVKGNGNNAFEVISTMTAANATALSHLVVFTKNGSTFTVYLDGVQKAQVTYSETLGGGFQIGSVHGGVTGTGIERVSAMTDATAKAKVFAKAIRVYDYVISEDQMGQLTTEFPYVSQGGKYTRTISENSNLSATNAWLNAGTQGNVDVPVNATVAEVTYYPDVEITTTAASTLTVNADMDTENIKFEGAGKLTIASDGTHNIHVYGSFTANSPVSIKYGEVDLSAVPVAIGESGSVEFNFSGYDFSAIAPPSVIPFTGNTSDYGNKVTAIYPSSDIYRAYEISHDETSNRYILTISPTIAWKQQQVIARVTPYYNGQYVGTGVGKYTISLGETSYANLADFGTAVMSWQTLDDYVEPTITLNMPTTGFYRFTSQNNSLKPENVGKYLHNYLADGALALNTTKDETTIFYVNRANNTIMAYENGKFLNDYNVEPTVGSSFTWTIKEGTEIGKYALKMGSTWYASDWNTTDKITFGEKDANALWAIEPVEELPLSIAAGSYASFSAPVAVTIPDDCYAYIATGEETGEETDVVNMTKVTGDVAANTGLIISIVGIDVTGPLSFDIAESGTEYASNLLVANVAAANVSTANNYFFGQVSGNYVFTLLSGDTYTLPGHKAYLNLNGSAARLSINWGSDDSTGLNELSNGNVKLNDGKYYQNGTVIVVRNGVKYNVAGQTIK